MINSTANICNKYYNKCINADRKPLVYQHLKYFVFILNNMKLVITFNH